MKNYHLILLIVFAIVNQPKNEYSYFSDQADFELKLAK